jgi:Family of unknown function (DUF5681)
LAPENTGQEQGGRFQKGRSGNPSGRPRGARNAATLACETLLEGEAERLTRKCIEMALGGDTVAMRLCLERLCAPRKDRPVAFPLPPITTARDAADVMGAVAEAVAAGLLTPGDAAEYAKVIDAYVKAYQTAELNDRVDPVKQLSTAELMRIASGCRNADEQAPKLVILNHQ